MIHLPLILLSACAFFSLFGTILTIYNDKPETSITVMAVLTFLFGLAIVVVRQ